MINDSLVAINIYDQNTNVLYNNSLIPILFYWNGKGNLLDSILNDDKFKKNYLDTISSYEVYRNLVMGYFHFELQDDGTEAYEDTAILISEHVQLKDFASDQIIFELVIPHLYELYNKALKQEYGDTKVFNQEIIIDIYKKIKVKYQSKFEKSTFINWVRSELINKDKIDSNNTNYIIKKLNQILEHEN